MNHTSSSPCAQAVCSLFEGHNSRSILIETLRATFAFTFSKKWTFQYLHFDKLKNIFPLSPHSLLLYLNLFPESKLLQMEVNFNLFW